MPDNLNIREQIAKSYFRAMLVAMSSYEPNILRTWESATDSMRKPCLEMADLLFSTPILERTCPECGGSKQVRVQVGLNDTPANFELRPCEHCSGLDFRNDYYSRWNYLRRVKNGGLSR